MLYLCLNPNKMIDRIGSLLTPLLLITILAMIIKGFIDFGSNAPEKVIQNYSIQVFPVFHKGLLKVI